MPIPLETPHENPANSGNLSAPVTEASSFAGRGGEAAPIEHAAANGSSAAQETKSEVEKAADKLYEERIEDEYAKREGGA